MQTHPAPQAGADPGDRRLPLQAMFGSYPKTAALKQGRLASERIALQIAPIATAQKGFKDVVRQHRYDVAELAIVTYLLAVDAGQRYSLLPFVMNGQFHHKSLYSRADGPLTPADLAGRRIAMRSYSQTTPTWVRGILQHEYGLALSDVQWLSQEGAHVAEYRDPAWVQALAPELGLEQALLAGEVDAVIIGGAVENKDRLRHVIADPAAAALAWQQRSGVVPINHVVVVKTELAERHPEAVAEVYRMLVQSRRMGEPVSDAGPDLQPCGFAAIERSLRMVIDHAFEQQLIKRRPTPESLYGPVLQALSACA